MADNMKKLNDLDLEKVAGGYSGDVVSSGSFSSNTGTQLNILVSWSVRSNGTGQNTLHVDVSSTSYSLYVVGSANGLNLTVNGVTQTAATPAINYGGKTAVTNKLGSFDISNVYGAVTITAVWHFNGTYSRVPIGDIRATGTINV